MDTPLPHRTLSTLFDPVALRITQILSGCVYCVYDPPEQDEKEQKK